MAGPAPVDHPGVTPALGRATDGRRRVSLLAATGRRLDRQKINVFQRWIDSGMAPELLVLDRDFIATAVQRESITTLVSTARPIMRRLLTTVVSLLGLLAAAACGAHRRARTPTTTPQSAAGSTKLTPTRHRRQGVKIRMPSTRSTTFWYRSAKRTDLSTAHRDGRH